MQNWQFEYTKESERALKKYTKKHPNEFKAVIANLDKQRNLSLPKYPTHNYITQSY